MKKFLLFVIIATTLFSSCKKEDQTGKGGTFNGPELPVHLGKAWTWIELNQEGNPVQLAIAMNDAALNSVPIGADTGNAGTHDHGSMENNWTLRFHPKADITPFNHMGMNWNPMGHEPDPIYGKPHFDFHFYLTSPEAIAAIPPYETDSSKFLHWPANDYFPPNYINPGGGLAKMGAHWLDVNSRELNGQAFTQTFIYGSYDGIVNFYEPMITLDFLKSTNHFERAIPQPVKVQKTGWYPTKLSIVKHDGLTEIIVNDFIYRTQS